jgi:hypothetical protein
MPGPGPSNQIFSGKTYDLFSDLGTEKNPFFSFYSSVLGFQKNFTTMKL